MDDNGQYYIYFPLTEIMERFNCGHDKASFLLNELEQHGLIARTLKGRGRPYRIVDLLGLKAGLLAKAMRQIGNTFTNGGSQFFNVPIYGILDAGNDIRATGGLGI